LLPGAALLFGGLAMQPAMPMGGLFQCLTLLVIEALQ